METRRPTPLHGLARPSRRRRRGPQPRQARRRGRDVRPLAPPRDTVTPAQFDAFHHALIKVKGARNLHMSSCILGLVLYGQFSDVCRASPLAATAVRRCLGIVLMLGSGVGFSGAAVVSEYMASSGASDEAVAVGRAKVKGHLIANVPIVALGLIYLLY